ncbi:lipid acyl hydrolase [Grosmannia clavigera kw1407]|uniref:Lipid acyl hydrolase n=1 Tax=Grosmannia clavigera (strain kw1407 / UAMH 11150) TaxID=655863 RepID=F0XRI4_GROCL|nr:lipid acyl hydrolase [Grosmannia clavigera kw1407]EFW99702.1 lipid acyl hydrolase [Grosmannia clavigera kw1407]
MSDSENERLESPAIESPIDAGDDDNDNVNGDLDSGDDLFGDGGGGDDDDGQLSEHSLGPEDEEPERYGDEDDEGDEPQVTKEELVMDVDLFRHRVPKPSDGTLQSLRVPPFIRICPEEYDADTYEPTAFELKDSHSQHPKSVARFRRDAATGALQSNAAFYRWDDGSVTLAIGDEHFEVLTKSLAPASATGKGTSTSTKPGAKAAGSYQELQDAHYYAAAAHLSSSLLLTVGHVAEQYSVRANRTVADDALQRLTDRLHAASQTSAGQTTNMMIIRTMRDPELAKKEAELAEKERERARRRRENASARLDGGFGGGGGGGSRSNRSGAGALSISDLEGGGRRGGPGGSGRKRGGGGAGAPRAKRRRPEYDSDDELPHGARRNDEYDKEDDFIAPSDDDMSDENGGDDDDEEELDDEDDEDEEEERRGAKHHKARRAKRQRAASAEDEDAQDAEADPDDDMPARRARRHIIDDDDDEPIIVSSHQQRTHSTKIPTKPTMAVNISLWETITFPLASLLWLHRVYAYILSFFTRDSTLDALWDELHDAETFEEWEAAGLALDHQYRIDTWRKDDKSKLYAWELIGDRLSAFSRALRLGHVQTLVHLLQSGLVRNLGNITVPPLYNESFAGTKYLIENYILQVCEIISDLVALPGDSLSASSPSMSTTPLLSPDLDRALRDGRCGQLPTATQKRQLFSNLRQSFGRTTLVLQGGSVFGLCHLGVARALFYRGLLPRILTGTGTGALIAALIGTHTDDELPGLLDGDTINLSAFAGHGDEPRTADHVRPSSTWCTYTRLATLRRRLARFRSEGYFLDASVLEHCVRDNGGDLTFEEAYRRTGRVLNITVVTGGAGDVPTLLNYVTAPNVLIWTAAVASNASDAAWYGHRQPAILCRDANGCVVAWPLADTARFRHWTHGRYDGTRQAPLRRLAQLFNVNHFVVSQARPHVVPFLEPSMQSPAMRGLAAGTLARARTLVLQQAGHLLRHRLDQLVRLGWLPPTLRRLVLDDEQQVPLGGSGSGRAADGRSRRRYQPQKLVLVPHVSLRDYVRLLDAPSPASLRYWIGRGERAVWPAVAALKIRCSVELALQQACEDLGVGKSSPGGGGGSGGTGASVGGEGAGGGLGGSMSASWGRNLGGNLGGSCRMTPSTTGLRSTASLTRKAFLPTLVGASRTTERRMGKAGASN